MATQTADESKAENIAKMGQPLGEQFSALWQEIAGLHSRWGEFVELYGSKKSRIDLLNQTAPAFFRFTQDALAEQTLLHISRLVDPPYSVGNKQKTNLTLRNLPELIDDGILKAEVETLTNEAVKLAEFSKTWRDKLLAHRDLRLAMGENSTAIPEATIKEISEVLEAMAKVMNAIERHYKNSTTLYKAGAQIGGAMTVLYHLAHAKHAQDERQEKLKRGEWSENDFEPIDL